MPKPNKALALVKPRPAGSSRIGNYRDSYVKADMDAAIQAVKAGMSVKAGAMMFCPCLKCPGRNVWHS